MYEGNLITMKEYKAGKEPNMTSLLNLSLKVRYPVIDARQEWEHVDCDSGVDLGFPKEIVEFARCKTSVQQPVCN